MTNERDNLRAVLDAALALLEARRNEMLTAAEWEALEEAADRCADDERAGRAETFSVDRQGALVRSVTPVRGAAYEHRCQLWAFENICHAAEEFGASGFTVEDLAEWAAVPHTQAAVALAFLKERGCVTAEGRRSYAAGGGKGGLHADAMTEYHALREKPA